MAEKDGGGSISKSTTHEGRKSSAGESSDRRCHGDDDAPEGASHKSDTTVLMR